MKIIILNLLVTAILLNASFQALSNGNDKLTETMDNIPGIEYLMENNAMGTEFYIAIPSNEAPSWPIDALEIYVSSRYDTKVTLETLNGISISKNINAGQVATFSSRDVLLYFPGKSVKVKK